MTLHRKYNAEWLHTGKEGKLPNHRAGKCQLSRLNEGGGGGGPLPKGKGLVGEGRSDDDGGLVYLYPVYLWTTGRAWG